VDESEEVSIYGRHVLTSRGASLTVNPPSGNHVSSFSLASTRAVGGDPVTATLTLDAAAGSGGAEILLTSSNTAAALVPASITITEGNSTTTFDVDTEAVTQPIDVTIRATYNGVVRQWRLTVVPSADTVTVDSVSFPTNNFANHDVTGTVTLSDEAPSGGVVVTLSGSRPGIATVPASVTVPFGESSATFSVSTQRSGLDRDVVVSAQYDGLVRTGTLHLREMAEARSPRDTATEAASRFPHRTAPRAVPRNTVFAPKQAGVRVSAPSRLDPKTQTETPERRFYFYTPELNLLAETELTADTTCYRVRIRLVRRPADRPDRHRHGHDFLVLQRPPRHTGPADRRLRGSNLARRARTVRQDLRSARRRRAPSAAGIPGSGRGWRRHGVQHPPLV
jgi:hypothetical protein